MNNIELLSFDIKGDDRGSLVALEENSTIPFNIKRVYYIFNTKHHVVRGLHAHRSLEQVLVCVNGSCTITVDDGQNKEDIVLNYPDQGLYIGNMIWREMKYFSQGCVLMVLASDVYNESCYINDYDEFINIVNS